MSKLFRIEKGTPPLRGKREFREGRPARFELRQKQLPGIREVRGRATPARPGDARAMVPILPLLPLIPIGLGAWFLWFSMRYPSYYPMLAAMALIGLGVGIWTGFVGGLIAAAAVAAVWGLYIFANYLYGRANRGDD